MQDRTNRLHIDPSVHRPAAAPVPARRESATRDTDALGARAAVDETPSIIERIFETSLDLILVVDRQGTLLRVSPSSFAILGYRPDEMTGRSAADFLFPDDLENTRAEMRLARRGELMRNFDCRYRHKDGRIVSLAWTGLWSEPDQQHFFIGRDMTERLKLEAQLRQAQKMEAMGQLTGGIAHDFNNILTTIIGMTELLNEEAGGDAKLRQIIDSLDQAAERGAQLVQRLLTFARKQPLQARTLDFNEIVTRMIVILQRTIGADITLRTALAPDLWPGFADASQLEDAILNLAVNARDAMPRGGQLVIETANVHLDEEYAAQHVDVAPGDYVALVVTDSGSGMPPAVIERVFEPFFTTKEAGRGTGLGLSMVYGFVKQSRGHVKIYSELGHGTSVRLYLPRAVDATTGAAAETSSASPRARHQETILVVEDDPAVRTVAVSILEGLGYRVRQAEDGTKALDLLKGGEPIDLLFTDLVLPNEMGGQDLLRQARELRPRLKALFTSGYSSTFIAARGDTLPDVSLLGKPYRKQKLAEAVRKALDA